MGTPMYFNQIHTPCNLIKHKPQVIWAPLIDMYYQSNRYVTQDVIHCRMCVYDVGSCSSGVGSMGGAAENWSCWCQNLQRNQVSSGDRTDNKKPLVTYRFINLSSFLDLSPGVFI